MFKSITSYKMALFLTQTTRISLVNDEQVKWPATEKWKYNKSHELCNVPHDVHLAVKDGNIKGIVHHAHQINSTVT